MIVSNFSIYSIIIKVVRYQALIQNFPFSVNPLVNLEGVEITLEEASQAQADTPEEMWSIVKKSSSASTIDIQPAKSRKGWKTIRLFVSSTFKDFHQEREVLVKQVSIILTYFHQEEFFLNPISTGGVVNLITYFTTPIKNKS